MQSKIDQVELKRCNALEENSSLSVKILDLENQLEEVLERIKERPSESNETIDLQTRVSIVKHTQSNAEIKSLKRTIEGLKLELERKEEWITVLKEHIRVKDRSLRDLKQAYLDLHSNQQERINSLVNRLDTLIDDKRELQRKFLQLCQGSPIQDLRLSLHLERGQSSKGSPVMDTLRRSELLYKSVDKTRAWNLGKFDHIKQNLLDSPLNGSVDMFRQEKNQDTITLMPLRNSVTESLYRSSVKSNRKSATIKRVRGGNTIQQFDPESEESGKDKHPIQTINLFECE